MELEGRVALVTGAGRRLGREIALALGRAGMDVVVHYGASRGAAEETASELERMGRRVWLQTADLSDLDEIDALFDEIERRSTGLDLLVNSAATFTSGRLEAVGPEDWDRALAVNLRAPFFCLQRAARLMRADAGAPVGAVVNIADLSGVDPWRGYAVHGVGKAGLIFLTRAAALELGPSVRVNAVAPGAILPPPGEDVESPAWRARGNHLPVGRTGSAADVCDAVLYLARADFVTGVTLCVDGGERLVGRLDEAVWGGT